MLGERGELRDFTGIELFAPTSAASSELRHIAIIVRVGTATKLVVVRSLVAVAVLLLLGSGDERWV